MNRVALVPILPLAAAIAALLLSLSATADHLSPHELLAGADARIEKHRRGDAIVSIVDASGKPVAAARVQVEQTRHAFLFGANIFTWGRAADSQMEETYRKRFAELLNFATLPFYWANYESVRGQPAHERTANIARWCSQHGILTKGHPLAWNHADPRWLPNDPDEIYQLQVARIEDCVERFEGLIDRWDVVNEATHFDREEFLRRAPKHTGMWQKVGQIEFTRGCFDHARRTGPQAILLINDYRTDSAYERVIEQLVDANSKRIYDEIGIQSHMHGGAWPTEKIWGICERFARFGVPLHFTETTILSGKRSWTVEQGEDWQSTPEGEAYQAENVARFYTVLFSHPAVEAITWWDFADYRAWKGAPAGLLRENMTPKPAYHVLHDLIRRKWWTRAVLESAVDGTADLRGFLGNYNVTISVDGREPIERSFTLKKGEPNHWQVKLDQGS